MKLIFQVFTSLFLFSAIQSNLAAALPVSYFDNQGRTDIQSGGVRMIPIKTSKGTF